MTTKEAARICGAVLQRSHQEMFEKQALFGMGATGSGALAGGLGGGLLGAGIGGISSLMSDEEGDAAKKMLLGALLGGGAGAFGGGLVGRYSPDTLSQLGLFQEPKPSATPAAEPVGKTKNPLPEHNPDALEQQAQDFDTIAEMGGNDTMTAEQAKAKAKALRDQAKAIGKETTDQIADDNAALAGGAGGIG